MRNPIEGPAAASAPLSETLPQPDIGADAAIATTPRNRRHLVATLPNPDPGSDYVVRFDVETTPSFALGPLKFIARYVPDRLLLDPSCLSDYLHALTQPDWPSLEALAVAMRDDISNEVIPRWIEILVSPSDASLKIARHSVLVEDRQPQWDNPRLLARLSGS
jgi:hypothetical protein